MIGHEDRWDEVMTEGTGLNEKFQEDNILTIADEAMKGTGVLDGPKRHNCDAVDK